MEEQNMNLEYFNAGIQELENKQKTGQLFNESELGMAYKMRGLFYFQNNNFKKSILDFDKGIEIMERMQKEKKLSNANELAMAYAGRGMANHGLGDSCLSSIPDFIKSIEIWECMKSEGKYVNEDMLTNVCNIIGTISGTPNDSMDENALAHIYMSKGVSCDQEEKFLEANQYYDQAIEIWERLYKQGVEIDNGEFAKAYMNRGANYYQTGKYDRALAEYNKGISIIEQLPIDWINKNAFDAFMLYKNRGMTYEVIGNAEAAIYDNIAAQSIIKKVFSEYPEFHELYYSSLVEMIELILKENDQELFNNIIGEFLYSMRDVPKTKEAEEIQNSILEQLN